MGFDFDRIKRRTEGYRDEMVTLQADLTAIPALGPENGGEGEAEKVQRLRCFLDKLNANKVSLEIQEFRAPDDRVPCGYRPNLVAIRRGTRSHPATWILTHLDVVPPGELRLWTKDPFHSWIEDGRIYGRGAEDNQQAMVASLFALKSMIEEGIVPPRDVCLAFVADEETGSHFGLQYLMERHRSLFDLADLMIVPDFGDPEGDRIEIAEKSILWLKVQVLGKQCHGSRPQDGINSLRAASHLIVQLDSLSGLFSAADSLFDPPKSSFEPTKKEPNVPNINTIPGEDVFYLDCRVLPLYGLEEVQERIGYLARMMEESFGVKVHISVVQKDQAAPPTSPKAPVVQVATSALREIYRKEPQLIGIGGGTVAAIFRRWGYQAACFSKIDRVAHQPNEYCCIDNMVMDCAAFAHCFLQDLSE